MGYEIFQNKKEIYIFLAALLIIFLINLSFIFYDFNKFKSSKILDGSAIVTKSFVKTKNNKTYRTIHLSYNGLTIYTNVAKSSKIKKNDFVNFKIYINKVTFLQFLNGRFYAKSIKISKSIEQQNNIRERVINKVESLHSEQKIANLYSALYFASVLNNDLRQDITKWGIAHLIAISGFHLGVIFATIHFLLNLMFAKFVRLFFPFLNLKFIISVFIFLILFFYLYVLNYTPSFLRAFIMSFIVFLCTVKNIKIFSFQTLFITILLSIALYPRLIFSISFYFSCVGVLNIFIFIRHFWGKFNLVMDSILLNLYVFLAMNIIVYYYFNIFSFAQIFVIIAGFIFIVFYPMSVFFHLVGIGDIFDKFILYFLNYDITTYQVHIPMWLFLVANIITLLSIRYKIMAVVSAIFGILPPLLIVEN